jgi:hypothetical protein
MENLPPPSGQILFVLVPIFSKFLLPLMGSDLSELTLSSAGHFNLLCFDKTVVPVWNRPAKRSSAVSHNSAIQSLPGRKQRDTREIFLGSWQGQRPSWRRTLSPATLRELLWRPFAGQSNGTLPAHQGKGKEKSGKGVSWPKRDQNRNCCLAGEDDLLRALWPWYPAWKGLKWERKKTRASV